MTAIAIQDVGETGYTCLYEQNTGIMRLHPNPAMIDYNMCQLQEKLPSWWKIFSPSLDGSVIGGYYDWEDEDGNIRPKFMYMVPVEGTEYMLAATTYIDEFSRPATLMGARIDDATNKTVGTINDLIGKTRYVFLGFFIFILIIVGGVVLIVSRAIVSPIKELTRGAGEIGKGDLMSRVEVHSAMNSKPLPAHSTRWPPISRSKWSSSGRPPPKRNGWQRNSRLPKGYRRVSCPNVHPLSTI